MPLTLEELFGVAKFKATTRQIAQLEKKLGLVLPRELKDLYAVIDEGHVNFVHCYAVRSQNFDMHAVAKAHYEYVSATVFEVYKRRFVDDWPKIVPFGAEGNGDHLCLDYRQFPDRPLILKLDHEIGYRSEFPFYYMARDFAELLDRAHPSRYAYYESLDDKLTAEELSHLLSCSDEESMKHRQQNKENGS